MDIEKTVEGTSTTLSVSGSYNTATARDLERVVDGVLAESSASLLIFDFSGLEYISSAGLRILMGAYKTLSANGGSLKVVNPRETVREVFEITGLVDILDIE